MEWLVAMASQSNHSKDNQTVKRIYNQECKAVWVPAVEAVESVPIRKRQ